MKNAHGSWFGAVLLVVAGAAIGIALSSSLQAPPIVTSHERCEATSSLLRAEIEALQRAASDRPLPADSLIASRDLLEELAREREDEKLADEASPEELANCIETPLVLSASWLSKRFPESYAGISPEEALYLRTLHWKGDPPTDEELAHIGKLEHLVSLSVGGTRVTDAGLGHLASLTKLRDIDLGGASISRAGIESLPRESLRNVHVQDSTLTDDDLAAFERFPALKKVKLDRTKVTDAGILALVRCSTLRHLELDQTGITSAGVRDLLRRSPSLRRVEVRGTAMTQDDATELQREFPNVEIVYQDLTVAFRLGH